MRRGLAVLLDVVYNHLGPDGNYTGAFGPYQTDRYRTPWGAAVNLDGPGSDEVRRFFVDNALGWLRDYHVDGLRIDAVHAFVDTSATHLLEQMADEVRALSLATGRDLVLIAESDLNDPRLVRPPSIGGYGLDATWSDDLHHALHVALTGERSGYYEDFVGLPDIVRAMTEVYVYAGRHSAHRDRRHGRAADGLDRDSSWASARTTTRSATGPRASGWPTSPGRMPRGSRRPSCCAGRSCRCCSRARSGPPRRRSSTSPTTRTPSSPGP